MAIKDRLRTMGFGLPDFSAMESKLDDRFEDLIGELRTMHGVLNDIRTVLMERLPEKGAPQ